MTVIHNHSHFIHLIDLEAAAWLCHIIASGPIIAKTSWPVFGIEEGGAEELDSVSLSGMSLTE